MTQAKCAKGYREKHREKVCERDNLRKNHKRELLKALNSEASKESLKNQRIAKEIYRQKKIKEAKDKAIIDSEPSHSQSPSTFFHPSTNARCLRKAASTLRKSPGKKMEIVKSLVKQFKLKINYDNQPKVERPKNNLADDDVEWLRVFFERPDITYTLLGTRDQRCTGKVNGESTFVQKRYLP